MERITLLSQVDMNMEAKKKYNRTAPLKDCSPAYPFSPFSLILSFSFTLSLLSLFRSALLSANSYLLTFNTRKNSNLLSPLLLLSFVFSLSLL